MQYNKLIAEHFDHMSHAGQINQSEVRLQQRQGHPERSCIVLYLLYDGKQWHARFEATGGVVLLAAGEYWARRFAAGQGCAVAVDVIMDALQIDDRWQSDVYLLSQATKQLDQQWSDNPHGKT